jgi:2-dehydropantoate 2-reductase
MTCDDQSNTKYDLFKTFPLQVRSVQGPSKGIATGGRCSMSDILLIMVAIWFTQLRLVRATSPARNRASFVSANHPSRPDRFQETRALSSHFCASLPRRYQPPRTVLQSMRQPAPTIASATTVLSPRPQNVVVVGAGAVGSYYGARCWEAGHSVVFYRRQGDQINEGLQVTSIHGDIVIPASQFQVVADPAQAASLFMPEATVPTDGALVDWVIVTLKSTAMDEPTLSSLLVPLITPQHTRVLILMNGLGLEEQVWSVLSQHEAMPRGMYGGMAFIACNRASSSTVQHSFLGHVVAGRFHGAVDEALSSPDVRTCHDRVALEELFARQKEDLIWEANLLRGRWSKNLWNLPFNGISVAMGGITIDQIMNDRGLRHLAWQIMNEAVAIANADLTWQREQQNANSVRKHTLPWADFDFAPFGLDDVKNTMALSDKIGAYKTSTMIDLTERRAMEVKHLFRIPLDRANRLGVPAPHLETIVAQIEAFQRMYQLY